VCVCVGGGAQGPGEHMKRPTWAQLGVRLSVPPGGRGLHGAVQH